MSIENLLEFIDRHTNNGAIYPNESRGEGVLNDTASHIRVEEEGITFIHSFSSRDWLALRSLNLTRKSRFWVECLIELLNGAYTEEARQMIIYIALNGTEENFFDAMECIRDFKRDVSIYTWLKLKNRSAEILRSKQSG